MRFKIATPSITILAILICFNLSIAQPVGYYNGTEDKSGEELKTSLNEIISNHVDFSYSFAKNIINYADADPENPDNVILFYLQESRAASNYGSGGDFVNREHVWAKSHGNFKGIWPMDGDAHNLHPADASVNEDRGNKDFDNIQPQGSQHPEALYCYYTDSTWEPGPKTKGQVARTLFYMATRYEGEGDELDLELVDHNHTYPSALHGNLDALLQWNRDYPPSDLERRRNERVFESQQNRNPFIDHPEFADFIWGNKSPSGIEFSEFQMAPEFPSINDELTVTIRIESEQSLQTVSLFWGNEYASEDNQVSMEADGKSYSGTIMPTGFSPNELLHLKVNAASTDSVYTCHVSYRFPEEINPESITSISEVQGTQQASPLLGQEVTIAGRITANYDYSFYLETDDAKYSGINIYNTLIRGKVGDSLIVRGTIEEYNNLTEIGNISYIYNYKTNKTMAPKVITTADFSEEYEGMLVTVNKVSFQDGGQTIPDANTSFTFSDQAGTGVFFVSSSSRLVGETLPTGHMNITGVLSQYNQTYQLLPRDKNDFQLLTDSREIPRATEFASIYPNPASEILYIESSKEIKHIKVFSLSGQLIKDITDQTDQISVSNLSPGLYLIHLISPDGHSDYEKFLKSR
jgi:endonuclease I